MTTLRVHYPAAARGLSVRGDQAPLDWSRGQPMTALGDDVWQLALELPVGAPPLAWKPLLDDRTWSLGPNYFITRGGSVDIYPRFFSPRGTVHALWPTFYSHQLGNSRAIWAYLPASYYENTRATYPVLYMQDGQNLFSNQPAFGSNGWQVDVTLDAATANGSIRELIVIAPESRAREHEYTPTPAQHVGGGADRYLAFLVDEVKPQVDARLRTRPERDHTGNLGSSLGGVLALYAASAQANVFGLVGAMSPSTWWDDEVLLANAKKSKARLADRLYVDCGSKDDGLTATRRLCKAYLERGHVEGETLRFFVERGARHAEADWARRLPAALAFLFGAAPTRSCP